jgi:hypothetical protein
LLSLRCSTGITTALWQQLNGPNGFTQLEVSRGGGAAGEDVVVAVSAAPLFKGDDDPCKVVLLRPLPLRCFIEGRALWLRELYTRVHETTLFLVRCCFGALGREPGVSLAGKVVEAIKLPDFPLPVEVELPGAARCPEQKCAAPPRTMPAIIKQLLVRLYFTIVMDATLKNLREGPVEGPASTSTVLAARDSVSAAFSGMIRMADHDKCIIRALADCLTCIGTVFGDGSTGDQREENWKHYLKVRETGLNDGKEGDIAFCFFVGDEQMPYTGHLCKAFTLVATSFTHIMQAGMAMDIAQQTRTFASLSGAQGSGKTETMKDLASILGIQLRITKDPFRMKTMMSQSKGFPEPLLILAEDLQFEDMLEFQSIDLQPFTSTLFVFDSASASYQDVAQSIEFTTKIEAKVPSFNEILDQLFIVHFASDVGVKGANALSQQFLSYARSRLEALEAQSFSGAASDLKLGVGADQSLRELFTGRHDNFTLVSKIIDACHSGPGVQLSLKEIASRMICALAQLNMTPLDMTGDFEKPSMLTRALETESTDAIRSVLSRKGVGLNGKESLAGHIVIADDIIQLMISFPSLALEFLRDPAHVCSFSTTDGVYESLKVPLGGRKLVAVSCSNESAPPSHNPLVLWADLISKGKLNIDHGGIYIDVKADVVRIPELMQSLEFLEAVIVNPLADQLLMLPCIQALLAAKWEMLSFLWLRELYANLLIFVI